VRARRLWPRSILQPPLTEADQRALVDLAKQEERRPEEAINVEFTPQTTDPDPDGHPRQGSVAVIGGRTVWSPRWRRGRTSGNPPGLLGRLGKLAPTMAGLTSTILPAQRDLLIAG
jgi:hypothetical protein